MNKKTITSIIIVILFVVFMVLMIQNKPRPLGITSGFSESKIENKKNIEPSRQALENCQWNNFSSLNSNFSFLYQSCHFGSRIISFKQEGNVILENIIDPNSKDSFPVIEIFSKNQGESFAQAFERLFITKLDSYKAKHCILAELEKTPDLPLKANIIRLKLAPDKEYTEQLDLLEKGNTDIPPPPCGDYGVLPDNLSYFEIHRSNPNLFIWVLIGQETPLFDEQSFDF